MPVLKYPEVCGVDVFVIFNAVLIQLWPLKKSLLLLPGIQWDNVHQSMAQGGHMTFGWMCWMMLFDSILYSVGGWYLSNIIPGKTMDLFLFHVFEEVI